MKRKWSRSCLMALVWVAVLLLLLEFMLRAVDPMAFQVRYDALDMISQANGTEQGYQVPAGTYEFWRWTVTIQKDGTRRTPDTHADAPCTLAILGDSVSFGYGVNDQDTYANQLARRFPDVNVVNAAQTGYNAGNIRAVYAAYEQADAFIYLAVDNDSDTRAGAMSAEPRLPQVSTYLIWLWKRSRGETWQSPAPAPDDVTRYLDTLHPLFEDDRVLVVTYGAIDFVPDPDVIVPITSTIAPGDNHPDKAGHREIAERLTPIVAELINRMCKEE